MSEFKFETREDYEEYINGLRAGRVMSEKQGAWQRRIPGLCAGDYGVMHDKSKYYHPDDYHIEVERPLTDPVVTRILDEVEDIASVLIAEEDGSVTTVARKDLKGTDVPATPWQNEAADAGVLSRLARQGDQPAIDEHARRKAQPIWSGFVCYFPDAMGKVAELSLVANEQHHPGTPLHWDKSKSKDHMDCLMRHGIDDLKGRKVDNDKVWHKTKVAWRAMAELQEECDRVAATKGT